MKNIAGYIGVFVAGVTISWFAGTLPSNSANGSDLVNRLQGQELIIQDLQQKIDRLESQLTSKDTGNLGKKLEKLEATVKIESEKQGDNLRALEDQKIQWQNFLLQYQNLEGELQKLKGMEDKVYQEVDLLKDKIDQNRNRTEQAYNAAVEAYVYAKRSAARVTPSVIKPGEQVAPGEIKAEEESDLPLATDKWQSSVADQPLAKGMSRIKIKRYLKKSHRVSIFRMGQEETVWTKLMEKEWETIDLPEGTYFVKLHLGKELWRKLFLEGGQIWHVTLEEKGWAFSEAFTPKKEAK